MQCVEWGGGQEGPRFCHLQCLASLSQRLQTRAGGPNPDTPYWFTPCLVYLGATVAELSDSGSKDCGLQSLKYVLSGPLQKKFAHLSSKPLGTSVLFSSGG